MSSESEDDYEEEPMPDFGTFEESRFYPEVDTSLANVVIIQNTPKVPRAKEEKLKSVLAKLVTKVGTAQTIEMPFGDTEVSLGFCFLEMNSSQEASKVVEILHNYKLDKSHVFSAMGMQDLQTYMNMPDEYVSAKPQEYKEKECLIKWLLDEQARDQYVITHGPPATGTTTEVFWNDTREIRPKSLMSRRKWTENFCLWSPRGTYLATMHTQGMALWGGESFGKIAKFPHPGAAFIDFSPCEKYLVSWGHQRGGGSENLIVWDVKLGTKVRGFAVNQSAESLGSSWPLLKWSSDDKYCCREIETGEISVFELPSMQPACKRIKSIGSQGLCFSPTKPWMSYWIPEHDNNPARLILQEIPSKDEIKTKALYNVAKCSFFWQTKGEYLAVQVDRVSKTGKTTYTNFELFRCAEKEIPVEVLEFKEAIHGFAWEPKGNKFCVLHGDPPRLDVSFYSMGSKTEKNPQVSLLHKLDSKAVNEIRWSPHGTNVIIAGLRNLNGALEWWSCTDKELTQTGQDEHFMATDIEWDPTGRFVATSVQALRHNMENGYNIWTSQGRQLCRVPLEHFQKLQWRPRPPTLLTAQDEKKLMKDLKKYRAQFTEIDDAIAAQAQSAEFAARRQMLEEFDEYVMKWNKTFKNASSMRAELRGYASDEEEYVTVQEVYEEVLEVSEEKMTN
jgi:translation initiation factor 3 subunit B